MRQNMDITVKKLQYFETLP
uniref:Uncharacterized protein n=1 Tax=Anguilla anguilla TaxID=7936 RepID=A0A0E9R7D8_ANGAN